MRVEQLPDDGSPGPAHASWAPPEQRIPEQRIPDQGSPEHDLPEAEHRAEAPGPVETPGHYDTGTADTGHYDTDTPDTGHYDTGATDTGTPDTGHYDAGATDTGLAEAPETPAEEPSAATDEPAVSETEPPAEQEEQPDVPTQRVDAAGTTYGEPLAEDEDEPAVGVATVPADEPAPDASNAEASNAEAGNAEEPEELAPDEVPAGTTVTFWEVEVVDGYRDRWQQIQLRFIDDPKQAAEQAHGLLSDVIDGFAEAVQRQREDLNRWQSADLDDTEELRVSVRRYRDLLDRLLGL